MGIRLTSAEEYSADINSLRADIIKNGRKKEIQEISISSPYDKNTKISVFMNFAFGDSVDSSLYILSFTGMGSFTFTFGINGNPSGSYKSLGYDGSFSEPNNELPLITRSELAKAIYFIGSVKNDIDARKILKFYSIIIVTISEALRFQSVEDGIKRVLDSEDEEFHPELDIVHNWGGHQLAGPDPVLIVPE